MVDKLGQGWGRGPRNPKTGQYDRYEYPKGHPLHPDAPPSITWVQIAGEWTALLYDFQRLLSVDVAAVMDTATWAWFSQMTEGVLAEPTSLLRRRLMPEGGAH